MMISSCRPKTTITYYFTSIILDNHFGAPHSIPVSNHQVATHAPPLIDNHLISEPIVNNDVVPHPHPHPESIIYEYVISEVHAN